MVKWKDKVRAVINEVFAVRIGEDERGKERDDAIIKSSSLYITHGV
ncbi:MAG: hypothetical protein LBR78_02355 [Holosporales bacterium]|nr:hypothetical protein [Holosporales bacterium]